MPSSLSLCDSNPMHASQTRHRHHLRRFLSSRRDACGAATITTEGAVEAACHHPKGSRRPDNDQRHRPRQTHHLSMVDDDTAPRAQPRPTWPPPAAQPRSASESAPPASPSTRTTRKASSPPLTPQLRRSLTTIITARSSNVPPTPHPMHWAAR